MDRDKIFRQPLYLGKAYLINAIGGSVIASGQGQFDTVNRKLRTSFESVTLGRYEGVLIVLETPYGYFAPFSIFSQSIIPIFNQTNTYSMESFLHWPSTLSLDYLVQRFSALSITVAARHFADNYQPASSANPVATITKRAVKRDIEKIAYDGFAIQARSTFHTLINHDSVENHARFSTFVAFDVTSNKDETRFSLTDVHKILSAFRVYWISSHDYVDCSIARISLGDMQCFIRNASFGALARNTPQYKPALDLDDPLELGTLVKLVHFYVNPDRSKDAGSSSKIGLAFSRIAARRYKDRHRTVDYEVIDLIFSLQSMAESIAQNEVAAANKEVSTETKAGIEKVRKLVRSVQDELPKNVRDFYLQKADKTYGAITRPTFMRSVEITFKKLGISMAEYRPILKEADEARRQIVHSEKYDGQFILDLLTRGVAKYEKDKNGKVTSVALSIKTGALDKLYELLKKMIRAYLNQYEG